MMSNQIKVLLVAFTVTAILAVVPASAVVINDFEGSAGNAIDWSSGLDIDADPNYSYAAVGVTSGSQSVRLDQCGWAQSLAFKLDTAQKADFMANSYFSIDMSVAATPGITSGYTQIYEVVMNAPGPGWTAVATGTPLNFYWWDGRPTETQTLFVDYSAFRQAITTTDYIEIILTTNNGGGAPCEMYFDNAQLYGGTGELGDYENEVMLDSPALYLQMETDGAFNSGSGSGVMIDSSGNNFWAAYRADVEFWANEGIGNCRYLPGNDGQNAIGAANSTEFPGWTFDFSDTYAFAADDISFELWFNADVDLGAYDVFFHQVGTRLYQAPGLGNSDGTLRVLNGRPTNPIPPDPNVVYGRRNTAGRPMASGCGYLSGKLRYGRRDANPVVPGR